MTNGKTALITGATSGIGAAFAEEFAGRGYNLLITGRRAEKLEAVARRLRDTYAVAVEVRIIELSDREKVHGFCRELAQRDDIEALVNNAGFGFNEYFAKGELDVWEKMTETQVLAPLAITHAVLPAMIKRDEGIIINVSSDGAFLLAPKNTAYSATKSFLKTFTECLHIELMDTHIRVEALCPGLTKTDFHEKMGMPQSRQRNKGIITWGEPAQVARAAMHALDKGKVLCIPTFGERILIRFTSLLPRKSFYSLMFSMSKKIFSSGKGGMQKS